MSKWAQLTRKQVPDVVSASVDEIADLIAPSPRRYLTETPVLRVPQ
jgi:hypothetical protein